MEIDTHVRSFVVFMRDVSDVRFCVAGRLQLLFAFDTYYVFGRMSSVLFFKSENHLKCVKAARAYPAGLPIENYRVIYNWFHRNELTGD